MTINNNNKNITLVKKGIEEELNRYEPKELNNLLWGKGLTDSRGPLSTDYLVEEESFSKESVDFVKEHELVEWFNDYYFDWHTHTRNELATTDEELLEIEDEEERWNTAQEWTDDDGFVWCGFENYIYLITNRVLEQIIEDKLDEYSQILNKEGFDTMYDEMGGAVSYSSNNGTIIRSDTYGGAPLEFSIEKAIWIKGILLDEEFIIYGDEDFTYKSFDDFLSKLKELKIIMNNNNILEVA